MIKKEALSALKGTHETVKIITSKQGSPFNESKKNKAALLALGIAVDKMVKVTTYNCFAGSEINFKELYEERAGEKKESRPINTHNTWVEGLEGILMVNGTTGSNLLRIYTDDSTSSKTTYIYEGEIFDDYKTKYAEFLKVRKPVNEKAQGLRPMSLTLETITSIEVDGVKVA